MSFSKKRFQCNKTFKDRGGLKEHNYYFHKSQNYTSLTVSRSATKVTEGEEVFPTTWRRRIVQKYLGVSNVIRFTRQKDASKDIRNCHMKLVNWEHNPSAISVYQTADRSLQIIVIFLITCEECIFTSILLNVRKIPGVCENFQTQIVQESIESAWGWN